MTPFELKASLESMTLLVDSREQPTENWKKRIELSGLGHERRKLEWGDYTCQCQLPDGSMLDFSDRVAIERKMNLDELCLCFGKERGRFEREFERAKEAGCRMYLLVENGSWEQSYHGKYRSRYHPKALVASIHAYRARYGMQLDFCKAELTGKLIREILFRELKEVLENEY